MSGLAPTHTFFPRSNITDLSAPVNPAKSLIRANNATLIAWLVLNVWPSHLGLPLLIGTILLSRKIRRHATFINMCITWMIVGFSSSLLLYAGYTTGPEPPRLLCLIQAGLLYAQPGMTSVSAFALVYQVFFVVRAAFLEKDPRSNGNLRKYALLIAPYVTAMVFAGSTIFMGIKNPNSLTRDRRFFYCSVKSSFLTNSITLFSFLVCLVTFVLEVWTAYLTYKNWRELRAVQFERGGIQLGLVVRVSAFGFWLVLGMSLSLLSIKAPYSPIPDMALATMGSAVVLIFGSQKDVLHAWYFWKRDDSSVLPVTDLPSSPYSQKSETSSWDADSICPTKKTWKFWQRGFFAHKASTTKASRRPLQLVPELPRQSVMFPSPQYGRAL